MAFRLAARHKAPPPSLPKAQSKVRPIPQPGMDGILARSGAFLPCHNLCSRRAPVPHWGKRGTNEQLPSSLIQIQGRAAPRNPAMTGSNKEFSKVRASFVCGEISSVTSVWKVHNSGTLRCSHLACLHVRAPPKGSQTQTRVSRFAGNLPRWPQIRCFLATPPGESQPALI